MQKIKPLLAVVVCVLTAFFVRAGHAQENYEPHINLIKALGDSAISTLTSHEISEAERKARFEEIFNKSFAVESIAQFVLGPYGRRATPQEKAEFLTLFKKTISDIYSARFKNYDKETFVVSHARSMGKKGVRVFSEIIRAGAPPVAVEWKVYEDKKGTLKIFDVIVERISMSTTQKSEFASIIQKNGGTVAGLNRALREKFKQ